jgi:hypothetical protein
MCRIGEERTETVGRLGDGQIQPHMHTTVADMPVEQPVELVLAHQVVEITQVGPQARGRNRGILPPRPGRLPVPGAPRQPGAVGPDPPQRRGRAGIGDDPGIQGSGHPAQLFGGALRRDRILARQLDEQPAVAAR